STPLEVTLEFRKRGTPDVNPPRSVSTLQPGATLYAPDMLSSLFNVENVTGFITVATGLDSEQAVRPDHSGLRGGRGVLEPGRLAVPGGPARQSGPSVELRLQQPDGPDGDVSPSVLRQDGASADRVVGPDAGGA